MGNCCDFIESDVRDKQNNQPQQGMVWVKNNKK